MGLLKDARFLLSLRDELAAEEDRLAARRMDLARRYLAGSDQRDGMAGPEEVEP
jgi:hypothetical protein